MQKAIIVIPSIGKTIVVGQGIVYCRRAIVGVVDIFCSKVVGSNHYLFDSVVVDLELVY